MALWLRGNWYWADFSVNGLRYRVPLRDSRGRKIPVDDDHHEVAARAEEREILKAERGELTPQRQNFARQPLTQAAQQYLASRRLELAPSSMLKEIELAARLQDYFKTAKLSAITTEDVTAYRGWRAGTGVGPALINMEVGFLRRLLKKARLWHMIGPDIKPLKEPESIGRALTFEEKTRLLKIASQKPEWETAYLAAILAINTTARRSELRAVQWRNVDFINRTLEIPKSKTGAGIRLIPLNDESGNALLRLRRRAALFGPIDPSHYVFAAFRPKFRFHNQAGARGGSLENMELSLFDPTRPIGSWRTAWRTLTKKAGLKGLRFHDLRHTAISALGEAGVPDRVIMDIAGHVSPRMLKRYSHIQLEAKRAAIQALSAHPQFTPPALYVTKHVTKSVQEEAISAEVIEINGRPERTRTVDLYRVKVAL